MPAPACESDDNDGKRVTQTTAGTRRNMPPLQVYDQTVNPRIWTLTLLSLGVAIGLGSWIPVALFTPVTASKVRNAFR